MTKRFLSILVAVFMVMAIMPLGAFAMAPQQLDAARGEAPEGNAAPAKATEGAIYSFGFNPYDGDTLDGWSAYDMDGDGNNWGWYGTDEEETFSYAYEGSGMLLSESYNSSGALTPDNWIWTPELEIPEEGATFSVYASGYSNWAAEHFAVYASSTEPMSEDDLLSMDVIVA